jgi:hypothetical protein
LVPLAFGKLWNRLTDDDVVGLLVAALVDVS